jgi:hypothetical protein
MDECVSNPSGYFSIELTHRASYDKSYAYDKSENYAQTLSPGESDVTYGDEELLGTTLYSCKALEDLDDMPEIYQEKLEFICEFQIYEKA